MAKALREVQKKVKPVDLVLEIRDARVPLASGNSSLQQMLGQKPRLIVLNKSKLVETGNIRLWDEWFARNNQPALFVDSFETKSLKKLTSTAREIMRTKWQSFRRKGIRPPPLRMIILGIPNTGKSTIINRLTRRNATRTGDRPGVTRSQEWIVLGKDLELLDTPGIMPPRIETEEQGLWLCAIHAIKDEILGKEKVATFVVDYLAGKQSLEFKMKYRLDDLKSEAWELIEQIGIHLNYKKKKGLIDIPKTCGQILQDFRQGLLGTCCFEFPPSPYHQQ
ncbi:MAG: ribosome biogenesis GTPase YlqF [Proteobacteria bacterium]|nr:ribosome biogenesis GTPase YlqF [Pseudomonadota bacterium]